MRNWNIQRRVLATALVPAALIALVLTAYHVHTRIDEVEASTLERGRGLARHLAPVAEFGVISGNRELLASIARSALAEDRTIVRVTIRDRGGAVLARAGGGMAGAAPGDGLVHLTQPIRRTVVAGFGPGARSVGGDPDVTAAEAVGRIELFVDLGPARREEAAVLLESLGISALALLVTGALALRIGRGVTAPVSAVTRTVERIRGGDLSARPPLESGGELGSLEHGIAEMAAEIEQTQSSMQRRVEQATAELQATLAELEQRNAELEEARREAEAASEFKSRFLANISHEIRTPMNSILGFTELLARADLDPVEADYLETIHASAQSLLGLLNGILDLSKVESGRMELEYADTDVNTLLVQVFQLLAPHAFQKGLEFVVHPAPRALARVRTDPVRLRQVLINLASNAVKFTTSGHVEVSARATTRADGTIGITFAVADTGSGIPESAQTRLFQAFAQGRTAGDAESYARESGTGLGLHIASEIVFLMEGLIEFRSEPGAGSTFWFSLELEPATTPAAPGPAATGAALALVDTEDATRDAHAGLFAAAGYPVHTCARMDDLAPDGDEAAIVVHVPARTIAGGDVAPLPPSLRSAERPVLAYAHAYGPDIRGRILAAGYAHILPKTPDPDALRRALEPVLAPPPSAGPARETGMGHAGMPEAGCVLVVDDHPVNRKLFASYLHDTGLEAVAAGSSDEALYHTETTRFDAIVLDIHLPARDGIETARAIRAGGGPNARTPIIVVTADAFEEGGDRAMAAGINELLVKPVSRNQLLDRLAAWCGAARAGDEAAVDAAPPAAAGGAAPERPVAYDREEAVRRAAGRPEVAAELFSVLQRSLPGSRSALAEAGRAADPEAVRAAAHRLRGAAAYCGVPRLERAVTEVERLARAQRMDALPAALAELDAAIEELLALPGDAPG